MLGQVVIKYGPITVIAGILTYYMIANISADLRVVKDDLHTHMSEQHFYLRQLCINTAPEGKWQLCDPRP